MTEVGKYLEFGGEAGFMGITELKKSLGRGKNKKNLGSTWAIGDSWGLGVARALGVAGAMGESGHMS